MILKAVGPSSEIHRVVHYRREKREMTRRPERTPAGTGGRDRIDDAHNANDAQF